MTWLKQADDKDALIQELVMALDQEHQSKIDLIDNSPDSHYAPHGSSCPTCELIDRVKGKKEATILDFPSYNREDEMKGDSGDFDPEAPVDRKKKIAPDPGPASLNPGMADISPQVFE